MYEPFEEAPETEELAAPRPARRSVRVLAVLGVVVLAALGVARLAGTDSAHHAPAAAQTSSAPVRRPPPVSQPVPVFPHAPPVIPHFQRPPACPRATDGQAACTTYRTLPAGVARALHRVFPNFDLTLAVTQVLRSTGPEPPPGLWSRLVIGHTAHSLVRLSVAVRESVDRWPGLTATGTRMSGVRFILSQTVVSRYVVQVEVQRVDAVPVRMAKVFQLAADRRLIRP